MVKNLKNIVQLDKQKGIIGLIAALIIMTASAIWFDFKAGIVFAVLFIIFGFFNIEFKNSVFNIALNLMWATVAVYITWYISYTSTVTLSDLNQSDDKMFLNILCILIICGAFFVIIPKWKTAFSCASVSLCLLASASGFIYQFRGKELCPIDFLSWATALNVAGQYVPTVNRETFIGWLLCLITVFAAFSMPEIPKLHKIGSRVIGLVFTALCLISLFNGAKNVKIQSWGDFGSRFNGFYLNFALGIRDLSFNKPEEYSVQVIKNYEDDYVFTEPSKNMDTPNIIAIMDEAYADFRVYTDEINTNQPVTPFIDSLQENTIRGYALASVFGGNTANSEFEFLTGNSLAFMPKNAIPYQQYIKGELYTLAWFMNSNGYYSTATHPCPSGNWSRGRIYPYFGFNNSTFEDDYENPNYIRNMVDDMSVFEHVLQKLDSKDNDTPMFLFAVTMQNHSGYNYPAETYSHDIELKGYSREYPATEQYLSMVNKTDKAVEYLLNELKNRDEKTIVVFFGDHQPAVENEFYSEIYGKEFESLEDQMLQYKVPFFIWANYDIEEKTVDCTSLNYLSRYLVEAAGFELTPFYTFLKQMEDAIPAMNALGYYSKQNNAFVSYDIAQGEEAEWIEKYNNLQYNNIFDLKNRSKLFFEKYIAFV